MKRTLIFVVAYQAEQFIASVLERIKTQIKFQPQFEVLIIDDASKDRTHEVAEEFKRNNSDLAITNLVNPINQGYGGNQQIGYRYAIENGFEVVIMIHGDGQYPPEMIHEMVNPILNDQADVMLGSRMVNKQDALAGGMPMYKWIGNQILTWMENLLLKQKLSEFHTGFRAYRVSALAEIPLEFDSKYFDFDTDILIQLTDKSFRIAEIAIPTKYGEEVSRVNGFKYGWEILKSCLQSRIMRIGLFYNPKFDYSGSLEDTKRYESKLEYPSSHRMAFERIGKDAIVVDLGAGPGHLAKALIGKTEEIHSFDKSITEELRFYSKTAHQLDLNNLGAWQLPEKASSVLMLDILEFLDSPEKLLMLIREKYAPQQPEVIISVGNVAFILTRLSLFFGKFNYGRLGILEINKKRLFTRSSLLRMLKDRGYIISEVKGIPAPFHKVFAKQRWFASFLQAINRGLIFILPGLFSYQTFVAAKPTLTLPQLLENAEKSPQKE